MDDLLLPDNLFRIASSVAALGWLVLALAPLAGRRAGTLRAFSGFALPLLFALAYVGLVVRHWGPGGFGTLAQVEALFGVRELLVAGWIHYLAFDLFVGSWIATRAAELRWSSWLVVPILGLTFMFGPAGLLAYAVLRAARRRPGAAVAATANA